MILDYLLGVLFSAASMVTVMWSIVAQPTRALCPDGWYLNGVRPTGNYSCLQIPIGDPEWDGTWQRSPDRSVQPPGELRGRIYCTGGSYPVVVSSRVAGCSR